MLNDSAVNYGRVTQVLHWAMALLVLLQFGKFADRINEGENWISETIGPWHTSIGSLLLILVAVRAVWALNQRTHRPVHGGPLGKFVGPGHFLLYAIMLTMPLLGMLYIRGNGYAISAFGTELVAAGAKIDWAASLGSLHSPLGWLLLAAVAGHIAVALFHQFVLRDDTMKRMIG